MDTVLKSAVAFFVLWLVLRLSGRRAIGQLTAFDLVMFLVIGSVTGRAIMGQDYSLTTALLIIVTFILVDIGLSLIERDITIVGKVLTGVPTILVYDGEILTRRVRRARVTSDQILAAARVNFGIERMEDIKFGILEADGHISIVPTEAWRGMRTEAAERGE